MPPRPRADRAPDPTFVGRETAYARAMQLIEQRRPLVTLVGPGGIGKTRLARELVRREADLFEGPACWIDLDEARTAEDLRAAVAAALGLRGRSTAERIGAALAGRGRPLVVLDHFDQLVQAGATWLAEISREAPQTLWLTTSRERLRVTAEECVLLDPLELPREGDDDDAIAASPAVRLFLSCARAAAPGFGVDATSRAHVARIVRRLEGVPLGIEIAAARAENLGAEALATELAAPARQDAPPLEPDDALQRAIAWSWSQLTPPMRVALARCSVFRGGFTFEAATTLVGGTPSDALDLVQGLYDRSLIRSVPIDDLPGERRLSLFGNVRTFASQQLDLLGERAEAERLHADDLLRVGTAWLEGIDGSEGLVLRRRLALEADNLMAVAERSARVVDDPLAGERPLAAHRALDALLALEPILGHARVPLRRVATLFERMVPFATDAHRVARARLALGRIAVLEGRFAETAALFAEAHEAAREASAPELEARALLNWGGTHVLQGDLETGEARLADATARLGDRPAPLARAMIHGWRAEACTRREDPRGATDHYQAGLALFRHLGDRLRQAAALGSLAQAWLDLGLLDRAERDIEASLAMSRELRSQRETAFALATLGRVRMARGDADGGRAALLEALEGHRRLGDRWAQGHDELGLAEIELETDAPHAARPRLGAARRFFLEAGDQRHLALAGALLAVAEATLGHLEAAERALEADAELAHGAAAIHAGHLDLARARACEASGEVEAARQHLAEAARRAALPPGDSEEMRFAVRSLRRAMPSAAGGTPTRADATATRVASDGSWIDLPDGTRVELTRRKTLQRLIAALVRAHRERPGQATSARELFAACWPGDAAAGRGAESRVFVSVTRLRKLGLGTLLVSRDDGFLLGAAVSWDVVEPNGDA